MSRCIMINDPARTSMTQTRWLVCLRNYAGAPTSTRALKLAQKPGSGETTELGACDEVRFRLRYI